MLYPDNKTGFKQFFSLQNYNCIIQKKKKPSWCLSQRFESAATFQARSAQVIQLLSQPGWLRDKSEGGIPLPCKPESFQNCCQWTLKAQETANLFVLNPDNLGCSCSPTLSVEFPGWWYVPCFFDRSTVATKSLREILHAMYFESKLSFRGAAGKGRSQSKYNKAHFLCSWTGCVWTFGYTGLERRTRWFVSLLLHVSRNLFLGETSTMSQWNPWGTQGARSSLDACHGNAQSSWSWKPSQVATCRLFPRNRKSCFETSYCTHATL